MRSTNGVSIFPPLLKWCRSCSQTMLTVFGRSPVATLHHQKKALGDECLAKASRGDLATDGGGDNGGGKKEPQNGR